MLLINQVVPRGCPRGALGQSPVIARGAGGQRTDSLWPSADSFLKEVIDRPVTEKSKTLSSQLRGQRAGGKLPDPAEGLYHLRRGLPLSLRRAGAGVVVEALSLWGCLWKVLLVEPQGGDLGKSSFSAISRTGERGPWLHTWTRALSLTCSSMRLTSLPLSVCRLRV